MHPTLYTSEYDYNDELNPKHAHIHHPRARASPQHSDFTDSPLESSSSGENDSFSKSRQTSRPSTSSGGLLNSKMQQLMTPSRPPVVQPVWPPVVIQLEEAPQEAAPINNMDTHNTRMQRIDLWRKDAATISSPSQDHAQIQVKGVRERTLDTPDLSQQRRSKTTLSSSFRCTACDTCYATRQGLKRHAQGVRTSPACRTAVAYFLE